MRKLPNIFICGTPCTGKTTLATSLLTSSTSTTTPLRHLPLNDLIKTHSLHSGYSKDHQSYIVDDDKLLDHIEAILTSPEAEDQGGYLIDWHSCEGFAERWVDLVVVVRCEDTRVLYDRLMGRGYKEEKVQENLDAEIFGVVAEEAHEGWEEEKVVELRSESAEDVEGNTERVMEWIGRWVEDRKKERDENGNGNGDANGE